jgi:hypothetical protein
MSGGHGVQWIDGLWDCGRGGVEWYGVSRKPAGQV